MLKYLPSTFILLTLSIPSVAFAAEKEETSVAVAADTTENQQPANDAWDSEKRQAALRVQLFLDKEGFGPGKIDGRWGGFSRKAADRWNEAGKEPKINISAEGELNLAEPEAITIPGDMITTYTVTQGDKSTLGTVPESPEAQSKLKELPYSTLMELVAEKFHADPDFIREINGFQPTKELEVGSEVKVPNVSEPFDISEPINLSKKSGNTSGETPDADTENKDIERELTVLVEQCVVELREAGELTHSFPISPGANDNRSPAGEWEVDIVSWMPEFRWDKSMLEDGERSDDSYLLPPGPNNPVGIVWIGISADGIGLHGTPSPDAIGRNRSHGCIRLSNWDALKLGKSVTPGTRVIIK